MFVLGAQGLAVVTSWFYRVPPGVAAAPYREVPGAQHQERLVWLLSFDQPKPEGGAQAPTLCCLTRAGAEHLIDGDVER